MMKKIAPAILIIMLAVSLSANIIVFAAAVDTTGQNGNLEAPGPTREDFFVSIARLIGLEPNSSYNDKFPDYHGSNEYVNEMISQGYVLGRNTGYLDLKDILTLEDMNYIFSRVGVIKPEPQIIYQDRYVEVEVPVEIEIPVEVEVPIEIEVPANEYEALDLGPEDSDESSLFAENVLSEETTALEPIVQIVEVPVIQTVEIPVIQPLPYVEEALQSEHLFYLASDGTYKCAFEDCDLTCPIGTATLPYIPEEFVNRLGASPEDFEIELTQTSAFFDNDMIMLDDGMMPLLIACNAEFYYQDEPISFFDVFDRFGSYFGEETYYDVLYHTVEVDGIEYIDWLKIFS